MSAPAASDASTASSSSTAESSSSQQKFVEVEEDPSMKEQLADQAEKASTIAEFRASLSEFTSQYPNASLVKSFLSSDRVVYRFLKARKFDMEKSNALFREAVEMREKRQLDTILQRPCPKGLEYKLVSKHGWHGFDKYGRPVFLKNTGLQHFPTLSTVGTVQERCEYTMYCTEYMRQVVLPMANERIGHKYLIDQIVTIVNLDNFGFHCIKQHNYSWVNDSASINSILYPESAGCIFIINAPRVFSMVWSIVKGWLDERTRDKVKILSGNGEQEIRTTLGDEFYESLPAEGHYGGKSTIMDPKDVPEHAMGNMIAHPISIQFIRHLKKRNEEAGLPSPTDLDFLLKDDFKPLENADDGTANNVR